MTTPRITSDPEILGGTPCFAGTRIPVSAVLSGLAHGWSWREVGRQWPGIEDEHIAAALRFAGQLAEVDPARLRGKLVEIRRRCDAAEKAARTKVDEVQRAGPSIGRSLAQWAARDAERRATELAAKLDAIGKQHRCGAYAGEICAVCELLAAEHLPVREIAR